MRVPIVASTERWASGTTEDVQGPPKGNYQHHIYSWTKSVALTSDDNEVCKVIYAIARPNAAHAFLRTRLLDDQVFEFTLWPAENKFHSCFFAQMPRVYTSLG